jgi:hypothetical protein
VTTARVAAASATLAIMIMIVILTSMVDWCRRAGDGPGDLSSGLPQL